MRWLALTLLLACVDAPKGRGEECSRTSQCDTPLVCRLQACRNECASSRDCPVDSVCLTDDAGLGACRLSDESTCSSDAECPRPSVCVGGACVVACTDDCPEGRCVGEDGEDCTGGPCGCQVERDPLCVDGSCVDECASDRDCRFGTSCSEGRCVGPDASIDVNVPDASIDAADTDSGIAFLPAVDSIGAGEFHTCATSGGVVHCWGNFEWAMMPDLTVHHAPRSMGLAAARVVTRPSARHVCAITGGGALHCLGVNVNGLVGDGTMTTRDAFVPVVGMDAGVTDVAVGLKHTCAIKDGRVSCWGNALDGALGDGRDFGLALEPIDIGFDDAVDVAAGQDTTCAIRGDGSLWCWGSNNRGRAALGDMMRATEPTLVPLPFESTAVSIGTFQGCVIAADQSLHCWGHNYPAPLFDVSTPTEMPGVSAVDVSVGAQHICVVTADARAQCFGIGVNGELGTGDAPTSVDPPGTAVDALRDVTDVEAGSAFTCARRGEELWCWGFNAQGQLGAGHRASTVVPVPVLAP